MPPQHCSYNKVKSVLHATVLCCCIKYAFYSVTGLTANCVFVLAATDVSCVRQRMKMQKNVAFHVKTSKLSVSISDGWEEEEIAAPVSV